MSYPSPVELKRALLREGFEIYRTLGDRVLLAERVRDNLIMDSGVAAGTGEALRVRVVLRAQANDFPGESGERLLDRARDMAVCFAERGYAEIDANTTVIRDPGNPERTLDTWHEVSWERPVEDLSSLIAELRYALAQAKTATHDATP
jgi:hypothetical protein